MRIKTDTVASRKAQQKTGGLLSFLITQNVEYMSKSVLLYNTSILKMTKRRMGVGVLQNDQMSTLEHNIM